jgi:hypothetical protein
MYCSASARVARHLITGELGFDECGVSREVRRVDRVREGQAPSRLVDSDDDSVVASSPSVTDATYGPATAPQDAVRNLKVAVVAPILIGGKRRACCQRLSNHRNADCETHAGRKPLVNMAGQLGLAISGSLRGIRYSRLMSTRTIRPLRDGLHEWTETPRERQASIRDAHPFRGDVAAALVVPERSRATSSVLRDLDLGGHRNPPALRSAFDALPRRPPRPRHWEAHPLSCAQPAAVAGRHITSWRG